MRRYDAQDRNGRARVPAMSHSVHTGKALGVGGSDGLLKGAALTTLVLQNSALAMVMRYTRVSGKQADMYISTTAVVMAEMVKVAVALAMQFKTEGSVSAVINSVRVNTVGNPVQYFKMGVPALLYTIQNNLAYVATNSLDGPTYQIICQSKIPITALLSVIILGKSLSSRQWVSLAVLTCGVGLVQTSGSDSAGKVSNATTSNSLIGFASAVMVCVCSGLAGVFFELMIKTGGSNNKEGPAASLWMRNIQLGSFSLLLGVLAVVVNDGAEVMARGFFSGYSPMVWLCISLHSLGGLAVAMVVKYADNVVKCFATSISIVLSCFLSIALLGMKVSQGFAVGALLVVSATYGYNTKPAELKTQAGPAHDHLMPKESV
ncbi:conserved unknown protein [Ectocarpus siliculosus]|uniref:Uncharacterized protein n=1 Tax=Ectocarpus siliculosus TaxID=2880 RepID=D8LE26_ECTSI|nr:conserved unknown protein [Ectocarpus siliculosus]|eukprot:CBN78543.1 conserved unknown protein [Ectocarpus siliculosus]